MTKDTLYIARGAVDLTTIPRLELLRAWMGMTPEMYASRVLNVASVMYVASVDTHLERPSTPAPAALLDALANLQNVGVHAFIDDDPNNLAYVGAIMDDAPVVNNVRTWLQLVNDGPSASQFPTLGDAVAAAVDLQVIADLSDGAVADKMLRRTMLDHHLRAVRVAFGLEPDGRSTFFGPLTYASAYLMIAELIVNIAASVDADVPSIATEAYASWSTEPSAAALVDVLNHRLRLSTTFPTAVGVDNPNGLAVSTREPSLGVYGPTFIVNMFTPPIVWGVKVPKNDPLASSGSSSVNVPSVEAPSVEAPSVEAPSVEAVDWVPPVDHVESAETYRADEALAELFDNGPVELNLDRVDDKHVNYSRFVVDEPQVDEPQVDEPQVSEHEVNEQQVSKWCDVEHRDLWVELGVNTDDNHAPTTAELNDVHEVLEYTVNHDDRAPWLTALHDDDPFYSVVCDLLVVAGEDDLERMYTKLAMSVVDDHALGRAEDALRLFVSSFTAAVNDVGGNALWSMFTHELIIDAAAAIIDGKCAPTLPQQVAIAYALVLEHHASGDESVDHDAIADEVYEVVLNARAGESMFADDDPLDLDIETVVHCTGNFGSTPGRTWTKFHRVDAEAKPEPPTVNVASEPIDGVAVFDAVLDALSHLGGPERQLLLSSAGLRALTKLATICVE